MAESDQHDPRKSAEVDIRNFYRADAEPPNLDRTSAKVDIRNFYRTDVDPSPRTSARIDIQDYYRSPEHLPEFAPEIDEFGHPDSPHSTFDEEHFDAGNEGQPAAISAVAENAEMPAPSAAAALEPVDEPSADAIPQLPPPVLPSAPAHPQSAVYRYIVIAAIAGVLFGVAVIVAAEFFGTSSVPYDLGNFTSDAVGLRGHLYTKWENRQLQYRLSLAPNDPDLRAGFALAVSNPPRPLSIGIQLKDAMGFVVCSREIALKFDPAQAAQLAAAVAAAAAVANASHAAADSAPPVDLARLQTDEAQREQGKDLFQNQAGPDGKIEGISAQGVIPCAKEAFEKTSSWSFTPNFPSIAEQNDWLKQQEALANPPPAPEKHRRPARVATKPLTFAIEADDVIVGYDAYSGTLEAASGESFYLDSGGVGTGQSAWQNLPVHIHYRCEPTSGCTLTREGSSASVHARLRR